jgi:type III restriction enzyme
MEIALKEFQEEALAELLRRIRQAKCEVREGDTQAVILASPTGSGKTVITTALMESILDGTGEIGAEPNAVFVWLSDQPELNEQSRKKIAATATVSVKATWSSSIPIFTRKPLTAVRCIF